MQKPTSHLRPLRTGLAQPNALHFQPIDACLANERKATNGSLGFQAFGFPKRIIFNASINKMPSTFRRSSATIGVPVPGEGAVAPVLLAAKPHCVGFACGNVFLGSGVPAYEENLASTRRGVPRKKFSSRNELVCLGLSIGCLSSVRHFCEFSFDFVPGSCIR